MSLNLGAKAGLERYWRLAATALVFLTVLAVGLYWCCQKEGMFLDEVYSYGLSNSHYAPFIKTLEEGDIVDKVLSHAELQGYVAVDEGERFDYASVYYNQTCDVHPPVFYFLLHTVCSLFPNAFSKWFGLGLNLVLFAACLGVLYSLSASLLKSRKGALLACLLYGVSTGALSMLIMVRMYMLLTLLSLALAWLVDRHMNRASACLYPAVAAVVFLGMMTQYFYAIYAFFVCAVYVLFLMYKRRWREALLFGASAVIGLCAMLLAFPSWWDQLHSQTTVSLNTAVTNATGGVSFYMERIEYGAANVKDSMSIIVPAALLVAVLWLYGRAVKAPLGKMSAGLLLLEVAALLSGIVVAVVSPYIDMRYLSNLLPMFALLAAALMVSVTCSLSSRVSNALISLLSGIAVLMALAGSPSYVYSSYENVNAVLEELESPLCVYVTQNKNPSITSDVPQLLHMDDVCVVEGIDSDVLVGYMDSKEPGPLVVFFARYPGMQDEQGICEQLCEGYGYEDVQKIDSENGFSGLYILEKTGR